jgi:transcription antitermination protein NusB
MPGERRKARIVALQTLYEVDCVGHDPADVAARLMEAVTLGDENSEFANHLVSGVLENRAALDAEIERQAPAWPLAQMALIDRNILRLALFEIMLDNSVPVKVSINEAVDLAKSFGGDKSYRFVNGVLGAVSAQQDR